MINWIRNIFSAPTPTTTATGEKSRRSTGVGRRSFPMGESGISAAVADWPTSYTSTVSSILTQGPAIMARARRLVAADPYAVRYLKLLENNVLGCNGFLFQSKVAKRNGRLDQKPNSIIEDTWWDWCKAKNASRNRQLSFYDICRTVLRTCAIDGGALVIRRRDAKNKYKFSVEIRSHEDLLWDRPSGNNRNIVGGIEYDDEGEPIAYWIRERELVNTYNARTTGKYKRYPADQVRYVFLPDFVGQSHGVSWFYPVGLRMKLQNKFDQAAVTHAAIGACQVGFIQKENSYDPLDVDENEVADIEEEEEPDLQLDIKPGTVSELPENYKFVPWSPQFPNNNYGPFSESNIGGMAVGLGVARTSLSGDLSKVNYSSIRAGVLEEREEWKRLQQWMIDTCVMWVFEAWFDQQFLTGVFPWSLDKREYLFNPSFVGRRWPWVDPAKDAQAHQTMLSLKLTSRKRILAEQGIDMEELDEEIANDENHPDVQPAVIVPDPSEDQLPPNQDQEDALPEDEQPTKRFLVNGYGH